MIKVQVTISCGCGFLAKNMKEASEHSKKTRHTQSLHGQIGIEEKLSRMRVMEVQK